jgi:hypothetical protein
MAHRKLKRLHSHKPRPTPRHRMPHHVKLDEFLALAKSNRPAFFSSEFDLGKFSNPDMDVIEVMEAHLPALPHTGATKIATLFHGLIDFEGFLTVVQNALRQKGYKVTFPKPIHYLAIDLWGKKLADVRDAIGAAVSAAAA